MTLANAGIDIMDIYLQQACSHTLLSHAEEIDLAEQFALGRIAAERIAGNGTEPHDEWNEQVKQGKAARDRLITQNQKLVLHVAKKYRRYDLPLADLIQAGNLGLLAAIQRYDPAQGWRFSTYASWWIRQAIVRALAYQHDTISMPSRLYTHVGQVKKAARELHETLDRKPSMAEVAARSGLSEITVRNAAHFIRQRYESLDEQVAGEWNDFDRADMVGDDTSPDVEAGIMYEELCNIVDAALTTVINPREERLLRMRYGLPPYMRTHTLIECGEKFGMTRERARQIEADAIRKIRNSKHGVMLKAYQEE